MNTLLLTIAIIITNILIFIPLTKIIYLNKLNNDLIFIYLSNVILTISFIIFFILSNNLFFAFYNAFFQMVFSYLLIYNIKNLFGKYNVFSIPYFILWVFIFSKILILYLF